MYITCSVSAWYPRYRVYFVYVLQARSIDSIIAALRVMGPLEITHMLASVRICELTDIYNAVALSHPQSGPEPEWKVVALLRTMLLIPGMETQSPHYVDKWTFMDPFYGRMVGVCRRPRSGFHTSWHTDRGLNPSEFRMYHCSSLQSQDTNHISP